MATQKRISPQSDRRGTARYLESMLLELRTMADEIESPMLVYFLEMATIEASDIAAGKNTQPIRGQKKPCAEELAKLYMAGALD